MQKKHFLYLIPFLFFDVGFAAQHKWYVYGSGGGATQMDYYLGEPNDTKLVAKVKQKAKNAKERFDAWFEDAPSDFSPVMHKRRDGRRLWGKFASGGIGYQFSPTLSIEGGYSGFFGPIKPFEKSDILQKLRVMLDQGSGKLKITSLQGINMMAKKRIPITRIIYGYGQCGLGLWLYNQAENDQIATEVIKNSNSVKSLSAEQKYLAGKIPLIASLLPGLGVQIKLHSRFAIDISWLYSMQRELSAFHILKAGFKFSL